MSKTSFKKFALLGLLTCSSLCLAKIVQASDVLENPQVSESQVDIQAGTIKEKLDPELRALSKAESINLWKAGKIDFEHRVDRNLMVDPLFPINFSSSSVAKPNNDMKISDGDDLAAHSATLRNRTGTSLNLSTASFTYTQQDMVTTQTSNAVGVELSASVALNIPFLAGASTSVTTSYNYNNSHSNTSFTTKTWNVPAQVITVPAGKSYKVEWVLKTGVATGTANLTSEISSRIAYMVKDNTVYRAPITEAISKQIGFENSLADPDKWDAKNKWTLENGKAYRKWTTGSYTVKCGTELIMDVYDVSSPQEAPKLVESIPMNVTPSV